jgi:hypothetical protein
MSTTDTSEKGLEIDVAKRRRSQRAIAGPGQQDGPSLCPEPDLVDISFTLCPQDPEKKHPASDSCPFGACFAS